MKLFQRPSAPIVSGPYLHRNLALYLMHPAVCIAPRECLTLDEALQAGGARLHETGRVGELEIENLSEADLYAQAGDVVKGGWQDRALGMDFIVPPRAPRPRRMRVRTFCVERGRWNRRAGDEPTNTFKSAPHMAASRELKLSIRRDGSQLAVWSSVDAAQQKLGRSLGVDVRSALSPSSLPLSVENETVRQRLAEYAAPFADLPLIQPDAAGFAFAVNGRLSSADRYAAPELFRKLWPRLLEAATLEALAEAGANEAGRDVPTALEVARWLAVSRRGRKTRHAVTPRVTLLVRENERQVSFETMDAEQRNLCVHQAILAH